MEIYFCRVIHERYVKPLYQFQYKLAYLYFDIDEYFSPKTKQKWRFLGGLLSIKAHDYGFRNANNTVRDWIEHHLANNQLPAPQKIYLLTLPRVMGFGFNPINFYFCFDSHGVCYAQLCEVNNTFGQKIAYILPQDQPQIAHKNLHVSPFFDLEKTYLFDINTPNQQFRAKIILNQDSQKQFQAILWGKSTQASNKNLLKIIFLIPLMTIKVVAAIHWQALKLAVRGAKFHSNPHADGKYELPNIDEKIP